MKPNAVTTWPPIENSVSVLLSPKVMAMPVRALRAKFGLRKTRAYATGSSANAVEEVPAPGGEL